MFGHGYDSEKFGEILSNLGKERGIDTKLEERLTLGRALPSLPGVAVQIIELGQDPTAGSADVAKVISQDPALTAKILRIANSPLYAMRRKVDNLRQALMLLGLNAALTLALSFTLIGSVRRNQKSGMDHGLVWGRSLMAGGVSRVLGEKRGLGNAEELFLAGLLQDIGMLVLDRAMPDEYGAIVDGMRTHGELQARERQALGADHAEVGAWLMETWNLPEYLRQAVLHSHRTDGGSASNDMDPFERCVALSGWIADIWLREDAEVASGEAGAVARDLLGLDQAAMAEVLDAVSIVLPEMSSLFEIDLVEPERIEATLEQAKEVLMIRNLQMLQEAYQACQQAEMLELRTRSLVEQTRRDGLTGLYNRTYLNEILATEFTKATECGWPLSVAFVDLDHFKQVNDTYGHQVGDQVLVSLAQFLASRMRQADLVARYGGEEFIVVLPGTYSADAKTLLDRLREEVAAKPHGVSGGQQIFNTISIGLATHREEKQFATLESLIQGADRALYTAKRLGRNRLEMYNSER